MRASVEQPPDGFAWTRESWGLGIRAELLSPIAAHVFTTRALALDADGGEWAEVARAVGASGLVGVRQVHGADVVVLRRGGREAARRDRAEADILVSDDPEIAIAVQAADCVPLLIADPASGAVAAAHAGWRGMAARAPQHAVRALVETFGARAEDLIAVAGPSIGPCCYEVGPELVEAFAAVGFDERRRRAWFTPRAGSTTGRLALDLWRAVADQLADAGVRTTHISVAQLCTAHMPEWLPSYRRDGSRAGRIAAAIRAGAAAPRA